VYHNGTWGSVCVILDSLTQQRELFALLSDTATLDGLLVTDTVPVVGEFGWTTFDAVARTYTSQIVYAGVITSVYTVTMFPSHALQTRLKQLLCLNEEEIHAMDVLKCFMLLSGERFVMMDSWTHQQELFAILLDSDTSEER